jgi:superfamily I DNA/RNA helicase
MPWDDNIEGPGRIFAAIEAERLRCLAGPGTGKTYALMKRVHRLLEEEEVDPRRVLVVTLTRTASDDLRKNLERLGVEGATNVRTCTLHSLCFSALMKEDVLAITERTPRLLLGFERDILLKDLPEALGSFTAKKKLLTEFQAAWSSLDGTPIGSPPGSLPAEFQAELIRSFKLHECMLVGELVPITRAYLADNPYSGILSDFDHILVDEYQDLNRADHGVIELLAEAAIQRHGHIAVIGDDDQCIYVQLRHAHPRGIVEFVADEDIPMVECRRCPKRITAMAQNLIEHNPGRTKPVLQTRPSNPDGDIHNVAFPTMEAEANGLAQFIHTRISSGRVEPGEVLILANWRRIAYQIRDHLISLGYDAHSYFQEEALDNAEAQKALTLLTLMAKPGDRVSLRSYLALTHNRENRAGYRRVFAYAYENGLSIAATLRRLADDDLRLPYTRSAIDSWNMLARELADLEPLREDIPALVDRLIPPGDEALRRLREAAERALRDLGEDETLETLSDALRLQIGVPEVPLDAPFIRLMSLHKSKGLTVKLVVIAGLVEGLVPRKPDSDLSGQRLEEHDHEQRRILFVGITRPTTELVVSRFQEIDAQDAHRSGASTGRWVGRGRRSTVASRLLSELGPELPRVCRSENWRY